MDFGQERMRLAALYAEMVDGELEELAEDLDSLTDAARQALKDEMDRRGINLEPESAVEIEAEEVRLVDPVTVVECTELSEALLARGLLASGGIASVLLDADNKLLDPDRLASDPTWGFSQVAAANAGFRLQVAAADLRAAREVLEEPLEEEGDPE